jgi:hypothetical protein
LESRLYLRWIDPSGNRLFGRSRLLSDEAFGVLVEGGVQGYLARGMDGLGLTVVDVIGRHQADAGVMWSWLYQSKKVRQNVLASWIEPKH